MSSTVIHEASMDIYYGDSREMETIPCQIKLQQPSGDISIEYFDKDYNRHITYRGREVSRYCYELFTLPHFDGRVTLNYTPTSQGKSLLEGFWLMRGTRGAWRITIGDPTYG